MNQQTKRLYRSRSDRMIGGICGGMGDYLNLDSTVVRLLFVILAFASAGMAVAAYIIMLFVIPEEPVGANVPAPEPTPESPDEPQI